MEWRLAFRARGIVICHYDSVIHNALFQRIDSMPDLVSTQDTSFSSIIGLKAHSNRQVCDLSDLMGIVCDDRLEWRQLIIL